MNKQIEEIRKKYGEPMLRMAIDHVKLNWRRCPSGIS